MQRLLIAIVLIALAITIAVGSDYFDWSAGRSIIEHGIRTPALVRDVRRGGGRTPPSVVYTYRVGETLFTESDDWHKARMPAPQTGDTISIVYNAAHPNVSRYDTPERLIQRYPDSPPVDSWFFGLGLAAGLCCLALFLIRYNSAVSISRER